MIETVWFSPELNKLKVWDVWEANLYIGCIFPTHPYDNWFFVGIL